MMYLSKNTTLERLEEFVHRIPDNNAVIYEPGEKLTFSELWDLSGKIYAWLKSKGIGAEDVVMYCLPRGMMLYACMVGTMRAGAAFVLTETQTSPERIEYIRKDTHCKLFADESCLDDILSCPPLEGYEPIQLHNLCYIAYTSGTTGHPKGVMHEYGSVDNSWKSVIVDGKPLMSENDTYLSMSPMSFVAIPIQLAYSCGHGCAISIMPYEYSADKERFSDYLKRAGITCGYITPSFLRKITPFKYPWHMCILSSEPTDGLFIPGLKCYNTYASTESGCLLAVYELPEAMSPAPVGRSYSDVELLIVDEDEKEVSRGEVGEVCFRTPYVRGYIHQQRKSARQEDMDHFDSLGKTGLRGQPGVGLFHTGDAGKILPDGNMVVLGRIDEMFKVKGYRIEPDEVAGAVTKVSGLSRVVIRGNVFRNISSIIAFYTDDIEVDPVSLNVALRSEIPEYMIPTNYIRMKEFPLLGSGKVDKLSLLPPEGSWDRFKKTASEQLPFIDKGRTASIYDMGCGIVLKQFAASVPYRTVWEEMIQTRIAHACELPVPEAYDITRSDDGYGILMDKLPGKNLEKMIMERPDERLSLIDRFAKAVKKLHRTDVSATDLPDAVDVSLSLCRQLEGDFCSEHEIQQISEIFECIPRTGTFTHGDCHPGNAMWDDGNTKFLDLTFAGKGHPVFDLLVMYSHYVFLPFFVSEEEYKAKYGMTKKEAEALYDRFLNTYYSGERGIDLSLIKEYIIGIHAARICLTYVTIPGVLTDEMLAQAKRRSISFSDKYCGNKSMPFPLPI